MNKTPVPIDRFATQILNGEIAGTLASVLPPLGNPPRPPPTRCYEGRLLVPSDTDRPALEELLKAQFPGRLCRTVTVLPIPDSNPATADAFVWLSAEPR